MESHSWAEQTLAPAAMGGQTVRPWDTGAAVAELQELLVAHGFSRLRIDGSFGYITEAAVKAFQRQQGLRIDGCVGPKTWAALKASLQPGTRLLRRGHTGADVAELQGLLRINGYTVDRNGIFCPTTHGCVHHFQQEHKLRDDGVVDAVTSQLMFLLKVMHTTHGCVHHFQQEHKLRDDGVVDAVTWAILRGRPLAKKHERQRRWFWERRNWW